MIAFGKDDSLREWDDWMKSLRGWMNRMGSFGTDERRKTEVGRRKARRQKSPRLNTLEGDPVSTGQGGRRTEARTAGWLDEIKRDRCQRTEVRGHLD